jgi:cytochrome c-type biogenesis protein CcmF
MHASWKRGQLEAVERPLVVTFGVALALGLTLPAIAYGGFHIMTTVGVTAAAWIILSSLYEPAQRLRARQSLSRGVLGMAVAHIGVGLLTLGVTITQTYRLEQDISLRPGESQTLRGYRFEFNGSRRVEGPNYTAVESEVEISRDGKRVAVLHPQKRTYRVQQSPMTEAGIEVDWNRDLFVAMGEDLGDGAWSMRLQYKPLVRFIWLGALVMALGGFIAITDRRYRTARVVETEPVRGAAPAR